MWADREPEWQRIRAVDSAVYSYGHIQHLLELTEHSLETDSDDRQSPGSNITFVGELLGSWRDRAARYGGYERVMLDPRRCDLREIISHVILLSYEM